EAATDQDGGAPTDPVPSDPEAPSVLQRIFRPVFGLAVLDTVAGFMYGGLSVVIVILVVDFLNAGEQATGYMWAAIGIGGVVGALISSSVALRPNLGPSLVIGAAVLAGGFVLLGVTDLLPVAMVAVAIAAAGSLIAEVVGTTVFQRVVPDEFRG